MIGRLVAGYVGDRLAGRRQHLQRLGNVDAGGLLNRMLHNLRRNERRLAVHVQREDIPSDEEDPVDVLEEVGEEVVHLGAALGGEPLEVGVQPRDPVLEEGDEAGQGRVQALPAQRAHRAQRVLVADPVRLLAVLDLLGGAGTAPQALRGSQVGLHHIFFVYTKIRKNKQRF